MALLRHLQDGHGGIRGTDRLVFGVVKGFSLVAVSPAEHFYHEYLKSPTKKLFMPTWSRDELHVLRTAAFSDRVREDQVDKLFYYFGGVPRLVLSKALDWEDELETLNNIISHTDLRDVLRRGPEASAIQSDKMLHFLVPRHQVIASEGHSMDFKFSSGHRVFSSKHVAERCMALGKAAARAAAFS